MHQLHKFRITVGTKITKRIWSILAYLVVLSCITYGASLLQSPLIMTLAILPATTMAGEILTLISEIKLYKLLIDLCKILNSVTNTPEYEQKAESVQDPGSSHGLHDRSADTSVCS